MAVGVGPARPVGGCGHDVAPRLAAPVPLERGGIGERHERPGEVARGSRPATLPVEVAALAAGGPDGLPKCGKVGDPNLDVAFHLEGQQDAVEGHAANERLRTVDGVDDPAPAGAGVLLAELLTQDAEPGVGVADAGAHVLLCLPVGHRYRREVLLLLHPGPALEVTQGDTAGLHRRVDCEFQLFTSLAQLAPPEPAV